MKRQVIITDRGTGCSVDADEILSDRDVLNMMVGGLIGYAQLIAKEHSSACDDPDCCIPTLAKEVASSLISTMNMHNLRHHKEQGGHGEFSP